ncbi:hypothetical protein [uncultured Kiloniella sp.]|uniref:hypothetical protein n=1 Tax=uncultured Kiloniella sp. TaxID=1133091 RepID=UPI0026351572|nr:hypothetical protein [uncultured Kiloniella sp.]
MKISKFHWLFLAFASKYFRNYCHQLAQENKLDSRVLNYLTSKFLQFALFTIPIGGYGTYAGLMTYLESDMLFFLYATFFFIALFAYLFWKNSKRIEAIAIVHSSPVLTSGEVVGRTIGRHGGLKVEFSYIANGKQYRGSFLAAMVTEFPKWKKGSFFPLIYSHIKPSVACPYDVNMCDRFCLLQDKDKPDTEDNTVTGFCNILGIPNWVKRKK